MREVGILALALLAGCGGEPEETDTGEPPETEPLDYDGDGYVAISHGGDDCNDADPRVNPGAEERAYNGVDDDCDPDTPDDDLDGDGFELEEDCDDDDPAVNPDATELGGNGIDDDCDEATCIGAGFSETGDAWALPSSYGTAGAQPFGETARTYRSCTEELPAFTILDLDGDGLLDLIVTSACGEDETGDTRWLVHPGEEDGFAESAITWELPADHGVDGATPFSLTSRSQRNCESDLPAFALLDLGGDGRLDLVITSGCDEEETGDSRWLVYKGGSGGFASEATSWSLPSAYGDDGERPFAKTASTARSCSSGTPAFDLLDLTSDGAVDLVVTSACDDDETGDVRWLVHAGGASGFGETASTWTLPDYGADGVQPFSTTEATDETCRDDAPAFTTRDLTGDSLPDLVLTSHCDDETGDVRWLLHEASDGGFATTATEWTLPSSYGTDGAQPFPTTSSTQRNCTDHTPGFATVDLTGEGLPDLLLANVCEDELTGDTRWLVHQAASTGFASEATDWALPEAYGNEGARPFWQTERAASCGTASPGYALLDLTGDGLPDLVITEACTEEETGDTRWVVHAGICDL